MASTIKGITIEVEGKTSGLVKSLQDVETQLKKDDAALKNLDKALKLDPTNVDLLAAKEAVLADKTSLVSQKMEILQQVQEDALSDLPEGAELSAAQMAELAAEIATTGDTLEELQGSADDASGSMEDVGDSAEETGENVEDSTGSFEGFGDAAETAGEVAEAALSAVATAVAAVGTAAVAAGAAIGSAFVGIGSKLTDATVGTSQLADNLVTLSKTSGLATDTLQELNYAAELLDVSSDTVTGSMQKLFRTMDSAAEGSKSATEAFTKLGVSFKNSDGTLRSTEEVFWDAIDALGKIDSETQRDAMAMDLFGKSARELNPLIEAGSQGFQDLAKEAHDVGYVMSGETLEAFGKFDDNMQRLSNGAQAVKQSFGQVLLPLLTDLSGEGVTLLQGFSAAMAQTGGNISKIGGVIEEFAPKAVALVQEFVPKILTIVQEVLNALLPAVISIAPDLITTIGSLIETVATTISKNSQSFINAFNSLFTSLANSITSILPTIIPIAVNLVMTLANALIQNLPILIDAAIMIIDTLVNSLLEGDNIEKLIAGAIQLVTSLAQSIIDNLPLILDAAVRIILALVNGLTESLPQLIPAALDAIFTIVNTLLSSGCLEQIISAALTLILTLAKGLIDYLPKLIEQLPTIIQGIVNFLTGPALPDILMAGFTLLMELVKAIPKIIVELVKAIPQIITCLVEGLGAGIVQIAQVGSNLIKGLWQGISDMASWIYNKIKGFGEGIVNSLKNFFGIHSPSKVFAELGGYCAEGLGLGFEDEMDSTIDDMEKAAKGAVTGVADALKPIDSLDTSKTFDVATRSTVEQKVDYSGGLQRLEQALNAQITAFGAQSDRQIIIPVYIGNEKLDTLIVDGIDRYNYTTGGH